MRPRKKLLLWMPDEAQLSVWRLVLDTAGYAVTAALSVDEALRKLGALPGCDLVVTTEACDTAYIRLRSATFGQPGRVVPLGVLLISLRAAPRVDHLADAVIWPGSEVAAQVRLWCRMLLARKRGPRKALAAQDEIQEAA